MRHGSCEYALPIQDSNPLRGDNVSVEAAIRVGRALHDDDQSVGGKTRSKQAWLGMWSTLSIDTVEGKCERGDGVVRRVGCREMRKCWQKQVQSSLSNLFVRLGSDKQSFGIPIVLQPSPLRQCICLLPCSPF